MVNQTDNSATNDRQASITIFCKDWCDYLQRLVTLLQKHDYAFTYIDLQFSAEETKELVAELGNPLILPVIDINGQYYERPSLLKVKEVFSLRSTPANI